MPPAVKLRRDEFEIVKAAAQRIERRSNSTFVMDQSRVEVTDEEGEFPVESGGGMRPKPRLFSTDDGSRTFRDYSAASTRFRFGPPRASTGLR